MLCPPTLPIMQNDKPRPQNLGKTTHKTAFPAAQSSPGRQMLVIIVVIILALIGLSLFERYVEHTQYPGGQVGSPS
jgi:hypothetical protein